jgi:hypothetical protein
VAPIDARLMIAPPRPLGDHLPADGLATEKRAFEVHGDDPVPFVFRELLRGIPPSGARTVDEDVHAPVVLHDAPDELLDLAPLRHVEPVGRATLVDVRDSDSGSCLSQPLCHRRAESADPARDGSHEAVQPEQFIHHGGGNVHVKRRSRPPVRSD